MKLLPLFFIPFLSLPAQSITWKELWEPFTYDGPYYTPRYYEPMCRKRVYREHYYPPTRWEPGYIRRWTEVIRVPCSALDDY